MPGARDIRAGRAFVEVGVNDRVSADLDKIAQKMSAFGQRVASIGKAMGAVGVGGLTGLGAAVGVFERVGTALEELHQRTGASVESLSKLGYAARQTGVGGDALETGLRKMSRAIYEAGQGSGPAIDGLAKLGLSLGQLQNLSPDKQLGKIADAIDKLPVGDRAGAAFEVLGRGAADMLPLLNRGSAGIDQMTRHAADMGLVVSGPAAQAAALLHERLSDLGDVAEAGAFKVGAALAPAIGKAIEALTNAGAAAGKWVDAHRGVVVAAGAAAGVLTIFGGALVGVGTALQLAGPAIGIITSGFGIIPLASTAAAFGIEAVGLAVATALSPVGLGVAAVVGLGAAFVAAGGMSTAFGVAVRSALGSVGPYVVGVFDRLEATLAQTWSTLKADATTAFSGIRGAITAGDWALAGKTVMDLFRLEVARATAGLWDPVLRGFYVVRGGLLDGWSHAVEGIETTWSYMREYLTDWGGVAAAMSKLWSYGREGFGQLTDYIGDAMARIEVASEARLYIETTFKGKTIDNALADQLSGPERRAAYNRIEGRMDLTQGQRDQQSKAEEDAIRDRYRKHYVGRELTDTELERRGNDEAQYRLDGMARERANQRKADDETYQQQRDATDKAFADSHPNEAAKGDAERKKIADQQSLQRQANDTGLAGILSEVGKGAQKAIDDADAAMKADATKAKTEQAKTEADDTKKAAADDATDKAPTDSSADPRAGGTPHQVGTFNPLALFGVGGGVNVGERIAKATERTAENTGANRSATPMPSPTAPTAPDVGTSTPPDAGPAGDGTPSVTTSTTTTTNNVTNNAGGQAQAPPQPASNVAEPGATPVTAPAPAAPAPAAPAPAVNVSVSPQSPAAALLHPLAPATIATTNAIDSSTTSTTNNAGVAGPAVPTASPSSTTPTARMAANARAAVAAVPTGVNVGSPRAAAPVAAAPTAGRQLPPVLATVTASLPNFLAKAGAAASPGLASPAAHVASLYRAYQDAAAAARTSDTLTSKGHAALPAKQAAVKQARSAWEQSLADNPALERARQAAANIPRDNSATSGGSNHSDPKASGKGGHDDRVPSKIDQTNKLLSKLADAVKGGGGLAFT
jgi:hypothetical protein